MSHQNKKNLYVEVRQRLIGMEAYGESRHQAKHNNHADEGKIFSWNTMKTYLREAKHFASYVEERTGSKRWTLEEARPLAREWIQEMNADTSVSAYSVHTRASCMSKLFQADSAEWGPLEPRHLSEITNNRFEPTRNTPAKYQPIIDAVKASGMRRSEVTNLTAQEGRIKEENGRYWLHITRDMSPKGGRERWALLTGEHAQELVEHIRATPDGERVFPQRISSHLPLHRYRAEYARSIYQEHARRIEDIPKSDRYYTRRRGVSADSNPHTVFDRRALDMTSVCLGHGRTDVTMHYFHE